MKGLSYRRILVGGLGEVASKVAPRLNSALLLMLVNTSFLDRRDWMRRTMY